MARTCLACASSERNAIDLALYAGEPLRNIAKRFGGISPASLLRHKRHVSQSILMAQKRRETDLGDSILDTVMLQQMLIQVGTLQCVIRGNKENPILKEIVRTQLKALVLLEKIHESPDDEQAKRAGW